jgi:SAM-dependent methyltransferase
VSDREAFVRGFHARYPGITATAFGRAGSYSRLAALVPPAARVLDLACGDGSLLVHLAPNAIGIDVSREELAAARPVALRLVQGRAQELPFASASFDACTCHLAFMLFDDIERVVSELARVLVPGGAFLALLGGGPTATGDDAFHRFLTILGRERPTSPRLGDPRARSEQGWRALFPDWRVAGFERWELDLGGTFDEVWAFLGASYEVPTARAPEIRAELAAATAGITDATGRIPCTAVTWLARAVRPAW